MSDPYVSAAANGHLNSAFSVNNMAKTAPYQLRNTDIRVNSICPGLIETGMTEATFSYAAARGTSSKLGQLNAMGRYGVPEGTSFISMRLPTVGDLVLI